MISKPIVKVSVGHQTESGKGRSWWVTLTNSAGQAITPMYRYADRKIEAFSEAQTWANFLGLELTLNEEDQVYLESVRDRLYSQYGGEDE